MPGARISRRRWASIEGGGDEDAKLIGGKIETAWMLLPLNEVWKVVGIRIKDTQTNIAKVLMQLSCLWLASFLLHVFLGLYA